MVHDVMHDVMVVDVVVVDVMDVVVMPTPRVMMDRRRRGRDGIGLFGHRRSGGRDNGSWRRRCRRARTSAEERQNTGNCNEPSRVNHENLPSLSGARD